MRRKKDDKRVLRSGNGRQNTSKRKIGRNRKNNFNYRPNMSYNPRNRNSHKKRKTSGTLILIMVLALVAFVIGAGIGVSLSFDDGSDDEGPQYENVTEEMLKDVNSSKAISYDKEVDAVDFNENTTSQLNIQQKESED